MERKREGRRSVVRLWPDSDEDRAILKALESRRWHGAWYDGKRLRNTDFILPPPPSRSNATGGSGRVP